jgi:hypothetical protein
LAKEEGRRTEDEEEEFENVGREAEEEDDKVRERVIGFGRKSS